MADGDKPHPPKLYIGDNIHGVNCTDLGVYNNKLNDVGQENAVSQWQASLQLGAYFTSQLSSVRFALVQQDRFK